MSGYETSFAGGEDEVAASPEFQHDASDAPDSAEAEEIEKIAEEPAGGMAGPEGFSTDTPAPAP